MKKYVALFLFLLISTVTFGQNNYLDVVYLKNGTVICGVIIEQVPYEYIKIKTKDGNIPVYQMNEIEKLTREPFGDKNKNSTHSKLKTGYVGIVELGVGSGSLYDIDALKLNIINGYWINPYFSLGLGTGLRLHYRPDYVLIPIFADFRAILIDKPIAPYLSLGVGYSFEATNDNFAGNGFMLNSAIGLSLNKFKKASIHIGIGYDSQMVRTNYNYGQFNRGIRQDKLRAISINAGISF